MSNLKKSTLAFAVAAALAPFTASAITVTYDADGNPANGNQAPVLASNVLGSNANIVSTTLPFSINTTNSDVILGRTTGFNFRITLNTGRFDNTDDGTGATIGAGLPPGTSTTGWTISRAGGGVNANTVTYAVNPPSDGTGFGVITGTLFTLPIGAFDFENLASLAAGGTLTGTIELQDPVGGGILQTISVNFLVTAEGVVVVCDPSGGDSSKRIDVAVVGNFAQKTRFSPNGDIGGSSVGPPTNLVFNAGKVNLSTTGLTGGFGGANNSAGNFVFDPAIDVFTVAVSGSNFAPFNPATGADRVFISNSNTCTTGTGVSVAGVVNSSNDKATIEFVLADLGFPNTGGMAFICVQQSSSTTPTPIDAQALSATVTVDLDDPNVRDPASAFACPLLPLQFNGSVVDVATFNPAGNTTQESFLRITNPSNVPGKVTIEGMDDEGDAGASKVTFNLPAGWSKQLNSGDLENGNAAKGLTGAIGDGEGKWMLTVTGEFGGMKVSSLNRNNTDGTLTNITDFDTNDQQDTHKQGL